MRLHHQIFEYGGKYDVKLDNFFLSLPKIIHDMNFSKNKNYFNFYNLY